jgi:predicted nucleic acid-binding protein
LALTRFLLDTSVLIDLGRRIEPTRRWFGAQELAGLFTSTITAGELYRGAHQRHVADAPALSDALRVLEEATLAPFDERVLAFDRASAQVWGRLMGEAAARGRTPPIDDAKIAAIALRHGLVVATSNTRHLAALCPTIDPRTV